jgi:hypothetical protein
VVEQIRLTPDDARPDAFVRAMVRLHRRPDERHYDRVLGARSVDVIRPDGTLLLALRKGALAGEEDAARAELAYPALVRAAKHTNNRPAAAGGLRLFRNNAFGFFDGNEAAFNRDVPKGWLAVRPLMRALDRVFAEHRPAEYGILQRAAARVPHLLIPGTAFTSGTASRDPTGVHQDGNNLPGGLGAMTVIRDGEYSGGLLVFVRWRLAVDLDTYDVLIFDNGAEAHGNTDLVRGEGAERISVIGYFHASNLS